MWNRQLGWVVCAVTVAVSACRAGASAPTGDQTGVDVAAASDAPSGAGDDVAAAADAQHDASEPADQTDGSATAPDTSPGPFVPKVTTIHVTAGAPLKQVPLVVRFMYYAPPTCSSGPLDFDVWSGPSDLPADITVTLPEGAWLPLAGIADGQDGPPLRTSSMPPNAAILHLGPGAPAPDELTLTIAETNLFETCVVPPSETFLGQQNQLIIPFGNNAVQHLLEGIVWQGRWWMAANIEGIGHCALPTATSAPSGWSTIPAGLCRHVARSNNRLFCTERTRSVRWVDLDPQTFKNLGQGSVQMPYGTHTEGMAVWAGHLYVTLHGQGLARYSADAPQVVDAHVVPALEDAWHVVAMADGKLVVADGAGGIDVFAPWTQGEPKLLGSLALPGLAAHVAVEGETVVVGAQGGGVHVVHVDAAGQPTLWGTLPVGPFPISGVDIANGFALASADRGYLAVPLPTAPTTTLYAETAVLTDAYMSLDVKAIGELAVTAEYAMIRGLRLMDPVTSGLPVAMPVQYAWTAPFLPSGSGKFAVQVWNPGVVPLHLTELTIAPSTNLTWKLPDSVVVPAGQWVSVPVELFKTAPGPLDAALILQTDDPRHPTLAVELFESPYVRTGQPLPPLDFADISGTLHNVKSKFVGKPSVLLLSAESCPVATERFGALVDDVRALAEQGKINVVVINPWDGPGGEEIGVVAHPFLTLYPSITMGDSQTYSQVLQQTLALPGTGTAPRPDLPLVYVMDAKGTVIYANLGYEPSAVADALAAVTAP